ncbi:MAG: hypothetical protein JWM41_3339 [Gemmatimonadetes bacterium]|nr:hypothetical protein [Gemmatimonadota bacterium]
MYSTCIFCHASLGTNEAVEHFPVGRRLVFDAARGRLWVVCRKCERWNLTPIEERWEAIEECERLFVATRLRVSTDNIGMARLRDGLELVRIGSPLRPEMAAWRYGDQFGRRRKRYLLYTGAGVAAAAGLVILGPATGIIAGGSWGLWNVLNMGNTAYQQRRVRARLMLPDFDTPVAIRLKQLSRISIVESEGGWGLRIPFHAAQVRTASAPTEREVTAIVSGAAALRAASTLLPAINAQGAKRDEVDAAVRMIGEVAEPENLFARYASRPAGVSQGHLLMQLPKEVRLALEMATHENSERRALEGELGLLEAEWQRAEEIAAIADEMFVSEETRERFKQLKDSEPR